MKELAGIGPLALGKLIQSRAISCVEAVRHSLEVIQHREPQCSTFLEVTGEQALAAAQKVQKRIDSKDERLSPLAGVPMAVSDSVCVKGTATTCGSKMLEGFRPPYSATVWERLQAEGGVLLGKTALDEFILGVSGENCAFGPARNPWDTRLASEGSAGAVSCGEAFYAVGSDGFGALRRSASFCGVSSLRPTCGTVSRYGLVAGTSSLEQAGIVGKTILDCAQVLALIRGKDSRDSTTVEAPALDWKISLRGLRIGIPTACFEGGLDPNIRQAVLAASKQLEALGASLVPVELPLADDLLPTYYVVACGEISSNLARYDGIRYGYRAKDVGDLMELYRQSRSRALGSQIKEHILLGNFFLSGEGGGDYHQKALHARELIRRGFEDVFTRCHMILSPVVPTAPRTIGEKPGNLLELYRQSTFTAPAGLAGLPAATVPCGFDSKGIPIGFQLTGRPFGEGELIAVAHGYQMATDFHQRLPGEVGQ